MSEPANIPTPPAWDFTSEGLRIWIDGAPASVIPKGAFGNLCHDLINQMGKDVNLDKQRRY